MNYKNNPYEKDIGKALEEALRLTTLLNDLEDKKSDYDGVRTQLRTHLRSAEIQFRNIRMNLGCKSDITSEGHKR